MKVAASDENPSTMSSSTTTNGDESGSNGSTPSSPSGRINYDRDFLIEIGNQPLTVFKVPEAFMDIARAGGNATSPTRDRFVSYSFNYSLTKLNYP